MLVKTSRAIIEAIDDDRDERKRFTGKMTISQHLREQEFAESLSMTQFGDSQPSEYGYRQCTPRQLTRQL